MKQLLLLLFLLSAAQATPLEPIRQRYQGLKEQQRRIERQRAGASQSYDQLSRRIEALKAERRPLLPGLPARELDTLLKRARGQAESLEVLDRKVQLLSAQREKAHLELLKSLEQALSQERKALAKSPAQERRAHFERLRALIQERSQMLQTPKPAPETLVQEDLSGSSPEELREMADEISDHAEAIDQQLRLLDAQIQAAQERQSLIRAAQAFRRDESLFAEDERHRRLVRRERSGTPITARRPNPDTSKKPVPMEVSTGPTVVEVDRDTDGDGDEMERQSEMEGGEGEAFGSNDAADPSEEPAAPAPPNYSEPEPAPPALEVGIPISAALEPSQGGSGLLVETAFELGSNWADPGGLSSPELRRLIQQMRERREQLKSSAKAMELRRRALESRAREEEAL